MRAGPGGNDGTTPFVPTVQAGDERERSALGRLKAGIIPAHAWGGFRDDTVRVRPGEVPRKPTKVQLAKRRKEARRFIALTPSESTPSEFVPVLVCNLYLIAAKLAILVKCTKCIAYQKKK